MDAVLLCLFRNIHKDLHTRNYVGFQNFHYSIKKLAPGINNKLVLSVGHCLRSLSLEVGVLKIRCNTNLKK